MGSPTATGRVLVARALAETLLAGCGDRWPHSIGVAERAAEVAGTVDTEDREILVIAAWLHDIGYGPSVQRTGFHPLDGAEYLMRQGWPERICGLVAHHSGARYLAEAHGLSTELAAFPDERSAVTDALTYADQTTGPDGVPMSVEDRIALMLTRHGPASAHARVHPQRGPYLVEATRRVEARRRPPVAAG